MRYGSTIVPGGTYFFTARLEARGAGFLVEHAYVLRRVVRAVRLRHPFGLTAWVALPDHLHAVLTLPEGDAALAMRWGLVKSAFAEALAGAAPLGRGLSLQATRDLWERRFRERPLRGNDALRRHVDAVHFDPVRHGLVDRAADWPFSSMQRFVRIGSRSIDWRLDEAVRAGAAARRRIDG